MKTKIEEIREYKSRDMFWTRIHFESDNETQSATVLVSTSEEYICDLFRISHKDLNESILKEWIEKVVKKWESWGDSIFRKQVHYDPYANTLIGKKNGFEFLKDIKP